MVEANNVWLWLSDDENWERFNHQDQAQIAQALARDDKGVILQRNDNTYFLDFLRLAQTNVQTGSRRPIYHVQPGASWVVQSPLNAEVWESFSRRETKELETAFFEGNDFTMLERTGTRSGDAYHYYVDFGRWTVVDLSNNTTRYFKIAKSQEGEGSTRSRSSVSTHTSCSRRSSLKKLLDDGIDGSERTATTEDCSITQEEAVRAGPRTSRRKKSLRASWRFHDESASWSLYDEEVAAAIEKSWESGAPEMMFTRESTPYFVDLKKLTQTNVSTGYIRPIQRVQEKNKSKDAWV